jgi:hypothetical protein
MPNVPISLVAEALKQAHVEPAKIREIVELLNHEVADDGEEKAPSIKKQFVVIISDPEGKLPKDDFAAWVVQIPEEESPATTLDRIYRGAYDFNCSKKGRMMPAKTVGDALENVSAKFFKEAELWVKTKTPVLVVKSDNQIPRDETVTVKGGALE